MKGRRRRGRKESGEKRATESSQSKFNVDCFRDESDFLLRSYKYSGCMHINLAHHYLKCLATGISNYL